MPHGIPCTKKGISLFNYLRYKRLCYLDYAAKIMEHHRMHNSKNYVM